MAKRKKRTTEAMKKKRKQRLNTLVIGTIIFSVLLAVLLYTNSGVVGQKLNEVLGGLMGILRYVLPIGSFVLAIKMACDSETQETSVVLFEYVIFLICIAIIMSVYEISNGSIDITDNLSQSMKKAYILGTTNQGGGSIGTLAAIFLVRMLGRVGAVVLSIGVSIMLFIFVCGIDISSWIRQRAEERAQMKEAEKIERQERMKEKAKYREEMIKRKQNIKTQKNNNQGITSIQEDELIGAEQIKINLNGEEIQEETERKGVKKFLKKPKEKEENVVQTANSIANNETENSLFVQVEEEKQDKTKQILNLEHAISVEEENYVFPPISILKIQEKKSLKNATKQITENAEKLRKTLYSFGVSARIEKVTIGPAITRYEIKPAEGVKISKIVSLSNDIKLNLAAKTLRIEAPIPGKQAVGIEVPNKEKETVFLREVIESQEFKNSKSKLSIALGKDIAGMPVIADIAKMPHVLIAGTTGSGKSVCINTIITSILYNSKPSDVKLVMIDPKVVELSIYNGIPHLLIPVVTDSKQATGALAWAVQEMDNRYTLFAQKGVRDLKGYNKVLEKEGGGTLPQIMVIIDELADLMMVAAKEVETSICRLAQKARAAGMHLVIATQRPSVDVITGLIKANVPSRIAFAVSTQVDSRTILDQSGAEKLLGSGDMLYYPTGEEKPTRVQGCFISDEEVEQIVEFIKSNGTAVYSEEILKTIENETKEEEPQGGNLDNNSKGIKEDPFLEEAIEAVIEHGEASTSFIQRRFPVGYSRAGRIIDQMEEKGVISGYEKNNKSRKVLWTLEKLAEMKMQGQNEEQE